MEQYVSDVARLKASIEAECQSLQALSLFTASASHAIIQAKYKALDIYHQELKEMIGETQAIETVVSIYNEVVK